MLAAEGFGSMVEDLCAKFNASRLGRASLNQGTHKGPLVIRKHGYYLAAPFSSRRVVEWPWTIGTIFTCPPHDWTSVAPTTVPTS